jgi:hypothetical protein
MTAEEFARLLDGREYGDEMSKEENELAAENRLFVFFGQGDDELKCSGIISFCMNAVGGSELEIVTYLSDLEWWRPFTQDMKETLKEIKEYEESIGFKSRHPENDYDNFLKIAKRFTVKAELFPEDPDATWLITTDVPHATFDIMEDGDLFCRGIVVAEPMFWSF